MENEEQKTESEWNDLTKAQESGALSNSGEPQQKNPDDTPTTELVADYEKLIGDIKRESAGMAEYTLRMTTQINGMKDEAVKLNALIAKRMGWPLEAPKPQVEARISESDPRASMIGRASGLTRVCPDCGNAIHAKGWATHQAAHNRHSGRMTKFRGKAAHKPPVYAGNPAANRITGKVGPLGYVGKRDVDGVERFTQGMTDTTILQLLAVLKRVQPIKARAFAAANGRDDISSYLTGLKERGFVQNSDQGLWTMTAKGVAALSKAN